MDITVLFSTFNGEDTLELMLSSLCEQDFHEDINWEVIAVNNNSNDLTAQILERYIDKLPLSIAFEAGQGKNKALNTGLKLARGNLIVLTDDDIIADRNWIQHYFNLSIKKPQFGILGGCISPSWPCPPPQHLLDEVPVVTVFALTSSTEHTQGEIDPCSLFGPNMAVRKEIFSQLTFNENIGPAGNNYVMGSETDFLSRAAKLGHKAFFSETVKVQHIINKHQFSPIWISQRAFKAGRALIHETIRNGSFNLKNKEFINYPRWALFQYVYNYCLLKTIKIFKNKNSLGYYKQHWNTYFVKGYASEYKKQRLKHKSVE
ncbi:glycosyltransferase [Endozoicomonas sp. G2_1]|uniref:glycosyltransferase n=1 Tax=Endozoicomonas sp. G2_1 TaxID=2821091 RepID=UPI001ADAD2F5|nr:glycosyltransferase [Endozoicomonas sp. G2_1]MBO9490485.1 glycosyltransferase [Endozoicomonas sp. G2_1]